MQLQIFDQFEFDSWESESFLAVAKEDKGLRGADFRVKDVASFYETTEHYDCFTQWQNNKLDKAVVNSFSQESECVIDLISTLKELAGIDLKKDQTVHIIHSEWNLLDIVWENRYTRYRVMWCMSA